MAVDAINIKKAKKVNVLIFGPGNSLDHKLIRNLDYVHSCKITDLLNFQEEENFIPISSTENLT
jgi:hypothetical protein